MSEFNEEIKEPETETEEKVKKSAGRELLEWVVSILVAIVVALVIRNFIFTIVRVDGPSMLPTLEHNDRLVVWKLWAEPDQGDVIVFQKPGLDPYIKRVIATEGQTVDIDYRTNTVYVDGKELEEDYILEPTRLRGNVQLPVTVGKDEVFVLGDNRNNSRDSRDSVVGCVKEDEILGEAVLRFWPLSSIETF